MKTFFIALGIVALMGVAVQFIPNTAEVTQQIETVYQVEKVDSLEERIKEAQEAARVDIETRAQAAYDALYKDAMLEVSDSIKTEYIAEVEATISSESY